MRDAVQSLTNVGLTAAAILTGCYAAKLIRIGPVVPPMAQAASAAFSCGGTANGHSRERPISNGSPHLGRQTPLLFLAFQRPIAQPDNIRLPAKGGQ